MDERGVSEAEVAEVLRTGRRTAGREGRQITTKVFSEGTCGVEGITLTKKSSWYISTSRVR